jgi:hypothetical protein
MIRRAFSGLRRPGGHCLAALLRIRDYVELAGSAKISGWAVSVITGMNGSA